MKLWTLFAVLLVGTGLWERVDAKVSNTFSLAPYKGRQSLVVFFAPRKSDPVVKEQVDVLRGLHKELKKSQITLIYSFADESDVGRLGTTQLRPVESQDLRRSLKVGDSDFLLVLIGRDGSIKRRSTQALTKDALGSWMKPSVLGSK